MNNIRKIRVKSNLTQEQMAKNIGVERSTVAKWETGVSLPRSELLPKLADVLNCTVDELLRPAEQKENPA